MRLVPTLLSVTRLMAFTGVLAAMSLPAAGAALFNLKGTALDTKLESENDVRMSVLGWTAADKAAAIIEEFRKYADSADHAAFQSFLQQQETKGYLFTKAATGYTIKYAWQEPDSADQRMVLLVTPALKTRNPYLWKTPNTDPAPFSLLEVRFDGDEATLKYSTAVVIEGEHLQVQDYEAAETFARLKDDMPYYLKSGS